MKTNTITAALSVVALAFGHGETDVLDRVVPANSSTSPLPPSQDPWYSAPPNFELAAPGTILKLRQAPSQLVTAQVNSSAGYNILYRTTDSHYRPTWAVTTLLVPITPDPKKLLSYQIAYDSADVDASPSYSLLGSDTGDISAALGRGWFVSSPDYEGPLASFTAGVISGHATLDAVRAVLSSGLGLNTTHAKYALWGYSGGALASEWAAELQQQYAPELNFAGAALGGLTPNVTSVLFAVNGGLEAGLIPAGILGLASQYPELRQLLNESLKTTGSRNATGFNAATTYSLSEEIIAYINQDITAYFTTGAGLLSNPIAQYVINRDGIMGYHGVPQMPVFAYKAIGDEVSPVADTDTLVQRYCNVGARIKYDRNTIGSHVTESSNGDARAVTFLTSVLSGQYNATGCQIRNVTVQAGNSTSSSSAASSSASSTSSSAKLKARTVRVF